MLITPQRQMGLEIEVQNLSRIGTHGLNNWLLYDVHDDGSIRDATYRVGELAVCPQFDESGNVIVCQNMHIAERIGLEIVTKPYPYEELKTVSQKLSHYFCTMPQTARTSIHVHFDVAGCSWQYIRNVLLWAHALEAPLFRISCGGGVHRGERVYGGEPNDHRYARPLSDPIGIIWGRSLGPLIRWNDLVAAGTASDFVAAWGRLDWFWNSGATLQHYSPHRLHALNIASILRLGTLEWRLFDAMYANIHHIVDIVYAMHMLASQGQPDFAPMLLGQQPAIDGAWMSKLINADCEPLWGSTWPKACISRARRSHYPDSPTLSNTMVDAVMRISNGHLDTGTADYPLYIRKV